MFGILGLIAIWAIRNNIWSGTATSRGWTLHNPIGFCLIVSAKAAFVASPWPKYFARSRWSAIPSPPSNMHCRFCSKNHCPGRMETGQ
jgi:hypothetical protein